MGIQQFDEDEIKYLQDAIEGTHIVGRMIDKASDSVPLESLARAKLDAALDHLKGVRTEIQALLTSQHH